MQSKQKSVFCGGTDFDEDQERQKESQVPFDRAANAMPGECAAPKQTGEFSGGTISTVGLNASVMKKKPEKSKPQKKTQQTGGGDPEDDPAGVIQSYKRPEMREVMIGSGQFEEKASAEMGTQCDPPGEEDDDSDLVTKVTSHPTILTSQTQYASKEDHYADKMLTKMEQEMTKGRMPGIDTFDQMMSQISQISTDMVKTRKELLKDDRPKEAKVEEKKEAEKQINSGEGKQQVSKSDKRKKLRDDKRSKQKRERLREFADGKERTQAEINESKENQQFENYYKGLEVLDPKEWNAFMGKLREPLDVCFRLNSIDGNLQQTKKYLTDYIDQISSDPALKDKRPQPVAWYPNQLAFSFDNVGRVEMRKAPAFKQFHKFLVEETENGRIFRQEKVSMIPVTLLGIKPSHKCLDMCAAPGSKTIQMLEYLHAKKKDKKSKNGTGFVIANDTDVKRAYMLTHQARRLNSPSLFVTNNDARFYPNLHLDENKTPLKFDRILCDVPCSGDGTLRKNLGLWRNFHCHMGHGNHPLQLEILERGFKLLRKGGRLTYSTCTFNPIENEAVVAAAVHRHIKQVKIVDVSQEVSPKLKYRPGLTRWQVYHRGKGKREAPMWFQRYKDVPDSRKKVVKETMFTDVYTELNNEPERIADPSKQIDPLGLRRCMRFYPHDDNQGGFFVAVIEKIFDEDEGIIWDDEYRMDAWSNPNVRQKEIIDDLDDFVTELEKAIKQQEEETGQKDDGVGIAEMRALIDDTVKERRAAREQSQGTMLEQLNQQKLNEEKEQFPFANLLENKPELWETITSFYDIKDSFPKANLAFQKDTNRNIVMLGDGLNTLMKCTRKNKLHVVTLGLKVFTKNKGGQCSACSFRILQEGVEALMPYMGPKRIIKASTELYLAFVNANDHQINYEKLREEWQTKEFEKEIGSAILCFGGFAVTIWIGKNNVSLMISKEEMRSIQFLLGSAAKE